MLGSRAIAIALHPRPHSPLASQSISHPSICLAPKNAAGMHWVLSRGLARAAPASCPPQLTEQLLGISEVHEVQVDREVHRRPGQLSLQELKAALAKEARRVSLRASQWRMQRTMHQ